MHASLYRRVAHSVSANLAGQVLAAAQNIVLVPLFLRMWGMEVYGDWLALSAAAAYLSMVDAGLQMYAVNLMNIYYSRREYNEFHQVLHSALLLYLAMVSAAAVIVACGAVWVPWDGFLHLRLLGRTESGTIFLLVAFSALAAIPVGLVLGVYRSIGEFARGQQIGNAMRLALLIATCAAIATDRGPLFLAGLMAGLPLLTFAIIAFDLRRRHSDIHIGIRRGSLRAALRFVAPSLFFFLFPLANLLSIQGTSILLSAALGSTSLVLFASTRTVTNLVRQLFSVTTWALWPEITTLYACGDFGRLRILHWRACKLSVSISVAVASFLFFFNGHVFRVWTGDRLQGDPAMTGIFLLNAVFASLWSISGTFQLAMNMHKNLAVRSLLSAVSTVALSCILVRHWGGTGIAAALLVSELLFSSLGVIRATCRILHESMLRLSVDIVCSCVPLALILLVSAWALSLLCEQSWVGLITGGIFHAIIASTTVWFFLLLADERRRVWSQVRSFAAGHS
jgi:O-antigen/teichoic acid export membrane protein